VELDPVTEAIVTIGSKEGIAHLCLATLDRGDVVAVPSPSYPIHIYGPVIAGANVRAIPVHSTDEFLAELEHAVPLMYPRPKMLILNFPANPTTQCVDLAFFERVVALCKEFQIYLVHDLAYADIVFDIVPPRSCRYQERRRLRSSFLLCRRATTCLAGAWALW
jgi:alanine-synthesizing transaminase